MTKRIISISIPFESTQIEKRIGENFLGFQFSTKFRWIFCRISFTAPKLSIFILYFPYSLPLSLILVLQTDTTSISQSVFFFSQFNLISFNKIPNYLPPLLPFLPQPPSFSSWNWRPEPWNLFSNFFNSFTFYDKFNFLCKIKLIICPNQKPTSPRVAKASSSAAKSAPWSCYSSMIVTVTGSASFVLLNSISGHQARSWKTRIRRTVSEPSPMDLEGKRY